MWALIRFMALFWTNISIEVLTFLASELVVRILLPVDLGVIGSQYNAAFLVQLIWLLNFAVILFIFHHTPFILLSCTVAVGIRLIVSSNNLQYKFTNVVAISKRLRYVGKNHTHTDERGSYYDDNIFNTSQTLVPHGSLYSPVPSTQQTYYHIPPTQYNKADHFLSTISPKNTGLLSRGTTKPNYKLSPSASSVPLSKSFHFPFPNLLRSNPASPVQTLNIPKPPHPPGIRNTGNICFINSVLQTLSRIKEFTAILTNFPNKEYEQFISTLALIIKQCQDWNLQAINPSDLLLAISHIAPHLVAPRNANNYQCQQDASEFLLWLLDTLHEIYLESKRNQMACHQNEIYQLMAIKNEMVSNLEKADCDDMLSYREYLVQLSHVDYQLLCLQKMSSIYELCCGQLLEARACQKCKRMSINIEYYTLLTLPLPTSHSYLTSVELKDCFALFSEVEDLLYTRNSLHCSCSFTQTKRLALFSYLPPCLIIQLARFSYNTIQNRAIKNQAPVAFPVIGLDLAAFTMEYKLDYKSNLSKKTTIYDLSGFCVHTGAHSTNHGHYIAYCKVSDGNWYCFDDTSVTIITNIQQEICKSFISQNAYIIFYTARDN